jgi:hypothetical protein
MPVTTIPGATALTRAPEAASSLATPAPMPDPPPGRPVDRIVVDMGGLHAADGP